MRPSPSLSSPGLRASRSRLTGPPARPPADANLFKEAFVKAQDTNKTLLGSSTAAPEVVASDAPVAGDATEQTATGEPVAKGKEAAPSTDAQDDVPPVYKDEGVAPPPEKTEVVQGEEVKEPTTEVRPSLLLELPSLV